MKTFKNENNFIADISGKLSRNTYVDYKTPLHFTDRQVTCLIWEELILKSNRSQHMKLIQEATHSKDIKARDSVHLGIPLGLPNKCRAKKPDISSYRANHLNAMDLGR